MTVAPQPSFQIVPDDRILTIGSCFARELELYLADKGFDLPTLAISLPAEERVAGTKPNVILNKYTVHSMENEIRWAFEGLPCPEEQFFLPAGEGLWYDSQLVHNLTAAPFARIQERREMVTRLMRQLSSCRVLVVTLGLVESWFDLQTGLYLNGIPPKYALQTQPDRFELRVLDYAEILASLQRIHALLQAYGHPDTQVLLTVSPVPFKSTLTGQDAVAANCYGKSVQRAAAEAFALQHDNVDYFPSYEIVTMSNRALAFKEDNIHVTPEAVDVIMSTVLAAYCPELTPTSD